MENKKSWFTLQPDRKLEALHFGKNEQGQEIFYPWGQPGNSYYIDQKQKKAFIRIYTLAFILGLCFIAGLYRPFEITQYISLFGLIILGINLGLFIERGLPILYARKLSLNKIENENLTRLQFAKQLIYLLSFQHICILLGLYLNHHNPFLWAVGVAISLLYPAMILQSNKNHSL